MEKSARQSAGIGSSGRRRRRRRLFENTEAGRQKERARTRADKRARVAKTKGHKGHERGTNRAEAEVRKHKGATAGRRRKEIGGNARANNAADARPTFRRQVSRTLKNAETERGRRGREQSGLAVRRVCVARGQKARTRR